MKENLSWNLFKYTSVLVTFVGACPHRQGWSRGRGTEQHSWKWQGRSDSSPSWQTLLEAILSSEDEKLDKNDLTIYICLQRFIPLWPYYIFLKSQNQSVPLGFYPIKQDKLNGFTILYQIILKVWCAFLSRPSRQFCKSRELHFGEFIAK